LGFKGFVVVVVAAAAACIKEKRYDSAKEALNTCLHLGYNDSTKCSELIKECDDHMKGDNHIYHLT